MDALRQWALCIIIAAAAGTFACAVLPRGSAEKTVRAVAGIFVVAAICAPLSQLDFENIFLPAFAQSYDAETYSEELDDYVISACKTAVESEVSATATEYGITVKSISVNSYADKNGCIIIQSIQIDIRNDDAKPISDFSAVLEEKLGAPVTVNAE